MSKQDVVMVTTYVVSAVVGANIGIYGKALGIPLLVLFPIAFGVGSGIGWVGKKVAENI